MNIPVPKSRLPSKIIHSLGIVIIFGLAIRLVLSLKKSLLWPQIISGGIGNRESVFITFAFLLLVALLVSIFVFTGRSISQRASSKVDFYRRPPPTGIVSVASVSLAFIHLICILGLAQIDITQEGFAKESLGIAYSFFRIGILISMTFAILSAGGWIASKIEPKFVTLPYVQPKKLIISLGLGIFFYAALGFFIGLLGLLNITIALAISLPAILASGSWLRAIRTATFNFFLEPLQVNFNTHNFLKIFLWVLVSILAVTIVLTKGLYPVSFDNDIWEHYFHFYEHVIQTGHVKPNEVWYQFYLSKGAGLFFIFMAISDFFAPQLVSMVILLLVSAIIFDIIKSVTDDIAWAATTLIVFYAYLLHDYDSGALFKHHFFFLGLLSLLAWCIYNLFSLTSISKSRVVVIVMMACCFYTGFYLPAVSAILCGMLAIIILFNKSKKYYQFQIHRNITKALFFIIIGGILSIGINWGSTGLGEMVPIKLFWMFADKERFLTIFGSNGLDYFMLNDSKIIFSDHRNWDVRWLAAVLRYPFFNFLLSIEILALGTLLILNLYFYPQILNSNLKNLFFVLVALMIPSILFAQYAQIPSTFRLFIFVGLFVAIACVCCLQAGITVFIPARNQLIVSSAFIFLSRICKTSATVF